MVLGDSTTSFRCGGSIINKNYILTGAQFIYFINKKLEKLQMIIIIYLLMNIFLAAHCVHKSILNGYNYKLISVRLGEHSLTTDPDRQGDGYTDPVVNIPVSKVIVHENFRSSIADDIALIRVAQPINFTRFVKPICLPFREEHRTKNFDGEGMVVCGFGRIDNRKVEEFIILQNE